MLKDYGVTLTMWGPVIVEDMKRVWAIYSATTPSASSKSIDEVGMTKGSQEMLVQASKIVILDKGQAMIGIC